MRPHYGAGQQQTLAFGLPRWNNGSASTPLAALGALLQNLLLWWNLRRNLPRLRFFLGPGPTSHAGAAHALRRHLVHCDISEASWAAPWHAPPGFQPSFRREQHVMWEAKLLREERNPFAILPPGESRSKNPSMFMKKRQREPRRRFWILTAVKAAPRTAVIDLAGPNRLRRQRR